MKVPFYYDLTRFDVEDNPSAYQLEVLFEHYHGTHGIDNPMKKSYDVSNNAKSPCSYHKHLRKDDQRRVNKSTRKLGKNQIKKELE